MTHCRDYLIPWNKYLKHIKNRNTENIEVVFMDKSFIHPKHPIQNLYVTKKKEIKDRTKKRRVVKDVGLLYYCLVRYVKEKQMERPVCILEWKRDTPHTPEKKTGKKNLHVSSSGQPRQKSQGIITVICVCSDMFPFMGSVSVNPKKNI